MLPHDLFTSLANPVRRQILEALLQGPMTVSALVERFQLGRPTISEHLQVLRYADLVRDEQRGRERYYHLELRRLSELHEWLRPFERYWHERMKALEGMFEEHP
jgi:DNA-binding transcriptional ArsR family regulator